MKKTDSIDQSDHERKKHPKGFWPAVSLFFLAPLVAEFLLGDLSIQMIFVVLILAPLYGGGALLIREVARRTGRGWPTIMILGCAYAIFEEAFTTQSLFNPDYLHKQMHLLDHAYIPALGMGGWWTIFMLNLHPVWSIGVSIALTEGLVPARSNQPWLKTPGLVITALLFAFGGFITTAFQMKNDPFRATPIQFTASALICVLLVITAFSIPKKFETTDQPPAAKWPLLAIGLLLGSICMIIPPSLGWGAVACYVALDLFAILLIANLSATNQWGVKQTFALASGAALAYAWHAFIQPPVMGSIAITRIGNAIFLLGLIGLIATGIRRQAKETFVPKLAE